MKIIRLIKVVIHNFRSFTDEVITFPITDGLRLITGINKVDTRLGANGNGKTSMWDAVCWCITGSSIRGTRTSGVISWGANSTEVDTVWSVDGIQVILRRYGPPTKVELNGEIVTQDKIDALFGLSRSRFLHSIIFGQGMQLFPDLSIPERGALLDEVLTLNIWQKAVDAAGLKTTTFEKSLAKMKSDLSYTNGQLAGLPSEETILEEISKWENEKQSQLTSLQASVKWWEGERENQIKQVMLESASWATRQNEKIESLKELREKWKEETISKAEDKLREIEKLEGDLAPILFELENFIDQPFGSATELLKHQVREMEKEKANQTQIMHKAEYDIENCATAEELWTKDVCPLCAQKIESNKKQHEMQCIAKLKAEHTLKRDEARLAVEQLTSRIADFNKQIQENTVATVRSHEKKKTLERDVDRLQQQISAAEREAHTLVKQHENDPYSNQITQIEKETNPHNSQLRQLQQKINPYVQQITQIQSSVNPFVGKLDQLVKDRNDLVNKRVAQENEYNKTEAQMLAAEYWKHGFKRIRLYFVQQVLAMLQIEVQSAVSALGLDGWRIQFATESETKSGTVHLGVQIHVFSPTSEGEWSAWSGGEAQRLRLAIAMGLASLIHRAAGCFYTCEIWDEPSNWLDAKGIEDLLQSLQYRAEALKKQIYIVDHRALMFSGFQEVWTVIKEKTGSKVYKHAELIS